MEVPEFLCLFSNTGSVPIKVKFKDLKVTFGRRSMEPDELIKLISPDNRGFIREMSFDELPFDIYKYEIDPIKNVVTIYARQKADGGG